MDMDIKDLEDLANDEHADLQQSKDKKEQPVDSPATPHSDKDSSKKQSEQDDKLEESTAAANSELNSNAPSQTSKAQLNDRQILTQTQSEMQVSQDLFYQKKEDDDEADEEDTKKDLLNLENAPKIEASSVPETNHIKAAGPPDEKDEGKKKKSMVSKEGDNISDFQSSSDLAQDTSIQLDGNIDNIEDLVEEVNKVEDGVTAQTMPSSAKNKLVDNENDEDFNPLREVLGESFYEDDDSSEDEGMPDYKIGGYHPIHVGEILLDRYVIIQKLGWGHFSTVWLTKDLRFNSYVALKVQKSAQHYVEAAYDEVDILDQVAKNWRTDEWKDSIDGYYKHDGHLMSRLHKFGVISESSHCAQLLNSFIHHGPNGKHFIMVFEILGVNFLEIIKRYDYKGVPLPLVRRLARQCLIGLDYMHRMCQIIHTDFKPENVVICLRDAEIGEISKTGQLTTTKQGKND